MSERGHHGKLAGLVAVNSLVSGAGNEGSGAEGMVNSVEISNYVNLPSVDTETVIAEERARYISMILELERFL